MNPISSIVVRRIAQIRLVVFDFDGVFTDNFVYVLQDGCEAVRCWRGDGVGLKRLSKLGIPTVILSTETNPVVSARAAKLGIRCIQGANDKLAELKKIATEVGVEIYQVAFVGNDINDLSCLDTVGFPIVVNDSHTDVISHALYCTKSLGGQGAVREVCDLIATIFEQEPGK